MDAEPPRRELVHIRNASTIGQWQHAEHQAKGLPDSSDPHSTGWQVLAVTAIFHHSDTEIALCHAQVEVITSAKVRVHPKVERAWLVVLGQSLTVLP